MKNRILLLFCLYCSMECTAQVRAFYKNTVNATILLYKKTGDRLIPHGTAFILYNYDLQSDESILVTCEHVTHHDTLVAAIPATDSLKKALLGNNQHQLFFSAGSGKQVVTFDGNNLLFDIPLKQGINYYKHPYLDLATIFCDLPTALVNKANKLVPLTNMKTLPKSSMGQRDDMYAGQEITFIGFPSGIGTKVGFFGSDKYSDSRTNPLFRKGIISWTSENADLFLVDGFSYGGNSGSPVFSIPDGESEGKFLGMVIGHLNDEVEINNVSMDSNSKVIVSHKTSIPVNNGLAQCIPAYIIYEFANKAEKSRSMLLAKSK